MDDGWSPVYRGIWTSVRKILILPAFRKYLDNIRKSLGGFTDESYEIDEDGNSTSGGRIDTQERMKIL